MKEHPENRIKTSNEQKAFKYKNYLNEVKSSYTSDSQRKGKFHEISKIMRNENISQEEKIFQAKLLADKISNKQGRPATDSNLLTSINAKLAILNEM